MWKNRTSLYIATCIGVASLFSAPTAGADAPSKEGPAAAAAAPDAPKDGTAPAANAASAITGASPLEVVASAPVGSLKNPYTDDAAHIEQGKKLYFSYSCNGCHGGGGGGGMCPPLTNDTWVYGSDDDTLFRLITLGSQDLTKTHNMSRKGQEGVVGPMPAFGALIKSDDELWKIIAFMRTLYKGNRRTW